MSPLRQAKKIPLSYNATTLICTLLSCIYAGNITQQFYLDTHKFKNSQINIPKSIIRKLYYQITIIKLFSDITDPLCPFNFHI